MNEPRKVVEGEVVREKSNPHTAVERVEARRIPGGVFFTRSAFSSGGDPKEVAKKLRDLKLRMWLFLAGFAAIAAGCFYGATAIDSVFFAAFLIVAGIAMLLAMSATYLLIRLVSSLPQRPIE